MDEDALDVAFLAVLNDHRGAIYRVCRAYANSPDEREDLVQEVVYQLWRAFPSYRREAAPITWVYRIALNTAITRLRRLGRRPVQVSLEAASQVASPPHPGLADARVELLYAAIRRLDAVDRALVMCYLDGLSYKEVADVLGLSESNVGVRLNRTKARLQELLTGEE